MKKCQFAVRSLVLCAFLMWFFAASLPVWAKDIPVDLTAQVLKYKEDEGLIEAQGAVVIKLEGVTIKADRLVVNVEREMLTAEGNVILETESYAAGSRNLTYDISSEVASLDFFHAVLSPKNIKGKLYVNAEQVVDQKTRLDGGEGSVTTCDYDHPHYCTKAQKIEYYPDDKVVGYKVTFYINEVPVLWMPYFVYPLKRHRSKMPTTGQNAVEGYFIKTQWDYFLSAAAGGLVFVDYMEKKGLGLGIEHDYTLDPQNEGRLYVYHIAERDTNFVDWVVRLDHTARLNPQTEASLGYESSQIYLVPAGRRDRTIGLFKVNHRSDKNIDLKLSTLDDRYAALETGDLNFSYKQAGYAVGYVYDIDRSKNVPHWVNVAHHLTYQQPVWDKFATLSLDAPYYDYITSEGIVGNARFEPTLSLTHNGDLPVLGKYTLILNENWHIDPDQGLYAADDGDQYLERQPEIILLPAAQNLPLLDISSSFSYGYYHEVKYVSALGRNRDFSTGRLGANVTAGKNIPLPLSTTLSFSLGLTQYCYNPGDARYQWNETAGLDTDLFSCFRHKLNFSRGYAEGNSPFFFDQLGSFSSKLTDKLTLYYLSTVIWNLSGGYNFLASKYDQVKTDLTLNPIPGLSVNMNSGFDIENQNYLDLVSGLNFKPSEQLKVEVANAYDLNQGWFKSASSAVELELGDNWRNRVKLKFSHAYDYFTGAYQLRNFEVVKDLHCWEMRYTYSYHRNEHCLIFTLKALPDEPLGWSTGKGFFYEGFDRAFDRIKADFYKDSPGRN